MFILIEEKVNGEEQMVRPRISGKKHTRINGNDGGKSG
jgi:hypothetical protein